MEWVKVSDNLPPHMKEVLAAYKNDAGVYRRIRAMYTHGRTVLAEDFYDFDCEYESDYDEETGKDWVRAGWHELIDNWGDYSSVEVCEGYITHWMPLPAPPKD